MGNSQGKQVAFTDQVNLNHFRLLRVVGKGAFGKVRIVERKDTSRTFALKYIRKDEVVKSESVRNIIRERRMLEQLNHPFLCNLRYSFQDVEYLYLIVDLMTGGDLRFHISRKAFTEDAVRFWIAELGCALRYIHSQGIVHRDVKPDNVLLDVDGHVHLADFNVASDFRPEKPLTSKSGTLAYLAPEVYEGRGYSCEVDWWSLGVLFYECIYNRRPFEGQNQDQLARRVRQAEPPFPKTNPPLSNPCLHAISSLLERDKKQRIGAAGFETFADSPFFRVIDFVALERKEIEPEFIPSSEKTNFDATYDLEELLLEEAPLEARARRQKPREQLKQDATTAEIRADELHRMIETMFEPFDYTLAQFDYETNLASSNQGSSAILNPALTASGPSKALQTHNFSFPNTNSRSGLPSHLRPEEKQFTGMERARSGANTANASPNGSPPLPTVELMPSTEREPPRSIPHDYFAARREASRNHNDSRSSSQTRRPYSRSNNNQGFQSQTSSVEGSPELGARSAPQHPPNPFLPSGQSSPAEEREKRPSGMSAFFSRKKGRERSPKARERGVLGKEGARVVVG